MGADRSRCSMTTSTLGSRTSFASANSLMSDSPADDERVRDLSARLDVLEAQLQVAYNIGYTDGLKQNRDALDAFERELTRDGITRMTLLTMEQPLGWIVLHLLQRCGRLAQ